MEKDCRNRWLAAAVVALAGCVAPPIDSAPALPVAIAPEAILTQLRTPVSENGEVENAQFVRPPVELLPTEAPLTETALIDAVLRQNPTLDEMRAAIDAAQAKVPQVTSLDDPTVALWTAPGSFTSDHVNAAARLEIVQKVPWPGKRELRGAAATAEAGAAARELDDARLRLVEATRAALADLFVAERALIVNQEAQTLLKEFRQNAQARYTTGLAAQQDVLQADVELARQEERAVALKRAQRIATARLNTLLHRAPDTALGRLPETLLVSSGQLDAAVLQSQAVADRPDVKALAERIRAEELSIAVAQSEYKPDVEVMAAYDGFWQGADRPLQWQLGARVNLPVRTERRDAAVVEAQSRAARRRAEMARLLDQIGLEVHSAVEQVREARQVIELYDQRMLPAAQSNVKEAQIGYTTGKVPFVALSEAQRTYAERRERYLEAQAELYRRLAALERVIGKPVVTSPDTPAPPSATSR